MSVGTTHAANMTQRHQHHWSGISMLSRCGEQYRRRYLEKHILPPAVAMIVGTGTDRAVTADLGFKIEHGVLLDDTADIARDAVNAEWDKSGVLLSEEEMNVSLKQLRGDAVDKAVRLARCHHEEAAPAIAPTHVQRAWTIEIPGLGVDLAGTIDVQEGTKSVRDTKTRKASPPKDLADDSDQLTMYALATRVLDGAPVNRVALDCLIDLKRGPAYRCVESSRDAADFRVLMARVRNAIEAINKGVFVPAQQTDWVCSPRWCGYAETCPYYRGRKQI